MWKAVLIAGISETKAWTVPQGGVAHLFCDAASTTAALGAALLIDDMCFFTHTVPAPGVVEMFRLRKDNQIMALELLAISLGLCTFQQQLRGRKVVIHCDNKGSEVLCLTYHSDMRMF